MEPLAGQPQAQLELNYEKKRENALGGKQAVYAKEVKKN